MEAETLVEAVAGHITLDFAKVITPGLNTALRLMNATTPARCANIVSQCFEESAGFHATEEYASGEAYNGRTDLGNIYPGDGPRFKGRSAIMVTGRDHYEELSEYLYGKKQVLTPHYFIDHPDHLGWWKYFWDGPIWYWNVARPYLNELADRGDIVGARRAVNGGTNGLDVVEFYWATALRLGGALLPSHPTPGEKMTGGVDELAGKEPEQVRASIANFGRATLRGKENNIWTHANFPDLVPERDNMGLADRMDRMESNLALLRHEVRTGNRTTPNEAHLAQAHASAAAKPDAK